MKPFKAFENIRLVFAYSAFSENSALNQSGPIFIDKNEVEQYSDTYNFPPEIKVDKENFPLTFIGYNKE